MVPNAASVINQLVIHIKHLRLLNPWCIVVQIILTAWRHVPRWGCLRDPLSFVAGWRWATVLQVRADVDGGVLLHLLLLLLRIMRYASTTHLILLTTSERWLSHYFFVARWWCSDHHIVHIAIVTIAILLLRCIIAELLRLSPADKLVIVVIVVSHVRLIHLPSFLARLCVSSSVILSS